MKVSKKGLRQLAPTITLLFTACSGGGDPAMSDAGEQPSPPPQPTPPPVVLDLPDPESVAFLTQATFGPTTADIDALESISQSEWLLAQFEKPPSYHLPNVLAELPYGDLRNANGEFVNEARNLPVASFWEAAIVGEDQLRQRMAYALSQILVTSGGRDSVLHGAPHTQAAYMDILVRHAFGNYRDLLEDLTYSVAMARYLTYLSNIKGDPETGRVPDENYARELMQLFTIGLIELNQDGTPKLSDGRPIETYTNEDISGLARVFTGLGFNGETIFWSKEDIAPDAHYTPLEIFPEWHSELEKSFLGTTIPAHTSAESSIDQALDTLFNHPNVGPFIGRQLIQRFVTSNPKAKYVEHVAQAFASGTYTLPDGTIVGEARRGDLGATIAAVLFDPEAREPMRRNEPDFGKLREPALRFTQWARAFEVNSADAIAPWTLRNTSAAKLLNQHPFDAASVFNFYRPGYVAPGSEAAAAGLVAPEFQLVNAVSVVGYANFMTLYIFGLESGANEASPPTFQPEYSDEVPLADDPAALITHLNALLANQRITAESSERIAAIIANLPLRAATRHEDLLRRVQLAILLVMTSPEYLIQR